MHALPWLLQDTRVCQSELGSLITLLTLNLRAIPTSTPGTYDTPSKYSPLFPLLAHLQIYLLSVHIRSALCHRLPLTQSTGRNSLYWTIYILILQFILFSICCALRIKTKPRILNFSQESAFCVFPIISG